jgi:homoserine O-acetyltransferase
MGSAPSSRYNYADPDRGASSSRVTEGLGIKHLRLVMGNSMGGMHAWLWGVTYPGFHGRAGTDGGAAFRGVGRNWMTRRMMIELIRTDPEWNGGNYTTQPRSLKLANVYFNVATNGGTLRHHKRAPTLKQPTSWSMRCWPSAGRPTPMTSSISMTPRGATTPRPGSSASAQRCLPSTPWTTSAIRLSSASWSARSSGVKNGKLYMIPASEDTRGHGTTGNAKLYKQQLQELLERAPRRTM